MGRNCRIWLLTLLLLIGAALRIGLLTDNRLHPDEALFTVLARLIITGRDPLLTCTPFLVDKPPFFYYQLVLGLSLSWGSELSVRLPGLFASMVSIALLARLARQLWRSDLTALIVTLICVLSPFAILFAPTAFADPLMVMWLLAALVAITSRRWGWAGMLFGLAVATKQTALLFTPLMVALGVAADAGAKTGWRDMACRAWRFAATLAVVIALIAIWDVVRAPAVSSWMAGMAVNNPGRLARSNEVWPRAHDWLVLLRYFTASDVLNVILLMLLTVLIPLEVAGRRHGRGALFSLLLMALAVGYSAVHWLVALPVLDRYLLPLLPVIALLAGRSLSLLAGWLAGVFHRRPVPVMASCALLIAALMARPAWQAAHSLYPVGSDHGAYDGIDQVADYLRALPEGSVVYYDSLGWSLACYLFDARVYLAPFATPSALAEDLIVFGGDATPRVIVLPGWESHTEVLSAVEQAGFHAEPVFETFNRSGECSFVIYRITGS